MQNRSDEIVTAFADTLDRLANHRFVEMPGHPRTCWACNCPKRDHERAADTSERGPVVELDLVDLYPTGNACQAAYDGPPRAARKHAP